MSTISPSLQIGGVNGWKGKEGAVLGWQQTSGGLFKPAKFDFTRLSGSASYTDENGLIQIEHRPNYPRFTYQDGKQCLMNEEARTNLFLNSETLSTQTVTVSNATEYTVSFRGTGSITFSGGHTGTLSGTGASDKVEVTFTTSSTSVTCTVSGTVEYANFEEAGYASSWIPTEGSAVTRAAESIEGLNLGNFLGNSEGGLYVDCTTFEVAQGLISINDNTTSNRCAILTTGAGALRAITIKGGVAQADNNGGSFTANTFIKAFYGYAENDFALYGDGSQIFTDSSGETFSDGTLTDLTIDVGGGSLTGRGLIHEIRAYDQRPANSQLESQTL